MPSLSTFFLMAIGLVITSTASEGKVFQCHDVNFDQWCVMIISENGFEENGKGGAG